MCLPSICCDAISLGSRVMEVQYAMETYGAAGDAVEALLALDGDVGAVGSLQLDIKSGCMRASAYHVLFPLGFCSGAC